MTNTKPNTSSISAQHIKHVAKLSNIPVTDQEVTDLSQAFEETLNVVSNLQSVDTKNIEPTHQVTGLTNVMRDDEVNEAKMFTQAEALANGHHTHGGYFVVDRVIDKDSG